MRVRPRRRSIRARHGTKSRENRPFCATKVAASLRPVSPTCIQPRDGPIATPQASPPRAAASAIVASPDTARAAKAAQGQPAPRTPHCPFRRRRGCRSRQGGPKPPPRRPRNAPRAPRRPRSTPRTHRNRQSKRMAMHDRHEGTPHDETPHQTATRQPLHACPDPAATPAASRHARRVSKASWPFDAQTARMPRRNAPN